MNVVVGAGDPPVWAWEDEPFGRSEASTLPELLVELGIYATRSEARRAGRDGPVAEGFTMLRASKKVPVLCIYRVPPPKPPTTPTLFELRWGLIEMLRAREFGAVDDRHALSSSQRSTPPRRRPVASWRGALARA